MKEARRGSGINEAQWRLTDAAISIQDIVYDEMLAVTPVTMEGIAIYAEALLMLVEASIAEGDSRSAPTRLGVGMSEALLRLAVPVPARGES